MIYLYLLALFLFLFTNFKHDTFVAALTKLLELTPFITQPPFASAVLIELRKSTDGKYFVQAVLKNNTITEPISYQVLQINGNTLRFIDAFKILI